MLFPTYEFLLFFLAIFPLAVLLKEKVSSYKVFLLSVNLIFYGFWGIEFLLLLAGSVLVNYLILKRLSLKNKKSWYIFGILFNLSYLGIFKYFNFFANSLFEFLNALQLQFSFSVIQIIAPIGISFYTFRLISHLVDSYQDKIACPNFLDYCIYVTYFPQILSGPIARAKDFYLQLNFRYKYEYQTEEVIILILSGLFKKYALSSFLFEFSRLPFSLPENYSSQDLILAAIAYSCLIYVDFSGYSDLANGISTLLGFKPIQNFNMPYQSLSLREFWRRWHISLSEFLRDYLYIPLGGSQGSKPRKYFNLILTMVIAGFWHGAGLNFIIWGGIHGMGLAVNHAWVDFRKKFKLMESLTWFDQFLMWLITFSFLTFSWIFFNTANFATALDFIQAIFHSQVTTSRFDIWQLYLVISLVLLLNFYGEEWSKFLTQILSKKQIAIQVIITSCLAYIILMLGPNSVPPFIYFNF